MVTLKCFSLVALCLMAITHSLFSQIILDGVVTDNGLEPVKNALVELTDQADPARVFSDYTDASGWYTIQIVATGISDPESRNPGNYKLMQNYPNPFNPATVIAYELSRPSHVRIEIRNVLGQKVKTLFDGFQSNLSGRVNWDGSDNSGKGVSAGVYIYSLNVEGRRLYKKMLLLDGGGHSLSAPSSSMAAGSSGLNVLNKPMSNLYRLRITGENIEAFEQEDLTITGNTTLNVTVMRTVTDIDGNVYRTVKIGSQWWLAENLKVTHYRNGEVIPNITDNNEWSTLTTGAYCTYNNAPDSAATWGCLYNWHAVTDSRNLAPEGWHLPSDEEWQTLLYYLGGDSLAGGKMKETGYSHWQSPNEGATNESGFTALAGGYRSVTGDFGSMKSDARFWSSTKGAALGAWQRSLSYGSSDVNRNLTSKRSGFSMRCVRDRSPEAGIDTLELIFEDPPFNLGGIDAQFARNVPYGPYEDNVFDLFLADTTAPTPLVVYIHGGGFTTGNKGEIYLTNRDEILGLLYKGVSFATINYRLLERCDDEGVIKSLGDSRRCLQFLRYHHEQLNIDPSRVALYGTSAGAGTSIWLAFSDDMADPNADDPILRESTRVSAAVARATQATYDLIKWETVVFVSLGLTLEDMGELMGMTEDMSYVPFYGADSLEQLGDPEFQAYRASVDMLALMSPDDPAIWVRNNIENVGIPVDEGELKHHVLHAVALSDRAAEVGVECVLYIPPLNIADPSGEAVVEFLLRQFGVK